MIKFISESMSSAEEKLKVKALSEEIDSFF